jgi:DNA-binding transcriptional MocR family regulator
MNAILRQDQIRAPGTGQDHKLRWQTPTQGKPGTNPGYQQAAPALAGNSETQGVQVSPDDLLEFGGTTKGVNCISSALQKYNKE